MIKSIKKFNKNVIWFSVGLLFLFSPNLVQPVNAAGASLYLSPNSGTFYIGSTFNVSIFVNTGGDDINTVQVDLKFDSKKLQVASPTAGKSFISVWVSQPTYSNIKGTISFKGGMPSPGINTSSGLVSTITFRAITPGQTTVSFLDSSKVLLDDGKGTDILTSLGRGVYTLSIPPPEGPEVFSSTHSDQNKWYKNNNPTFSWVKEEGINAFSYSLDNDSQGVPDNIPEGDFTSISYSDLKDGIWYFHIKARKDGVWGGTSHYLVQIDSTPPASFTSEVSPSTKTSVSQPIISFITTDALSGFDHFEIKVIDITLDREEKEVAFFIEGVSPYKLPALEVGKYMLVIRAFDRAGNWRDESIKIEIIPKGIAVNKNGIWIYGMFFAIWLIALFIFLLIILIICVLVHQWKKHQGSQVKIKQRLKEREKELKDNSERIKIKVKKN